MAEWSGKRVKKSCEDCEQLADPKAFAIGTKVRIIEAFDCANCEVTKSRPILENENILELYEALPERFDPMTGLRIITTDDIKFLFDIYDVPKMLWYDYYNRLKYFCEQLRIVHTQAKEDERGEEKALEEWKESKRGLSRKRMKTTH